MFTPVRTSLACTNVRTHWAFTTVWTSWTFTTVRTSWTSQLLELLERVQLLGLIWLLPLLRLIGCFKTVRASWTFTTVRTSWLCKTTIAKRQLNKCIAKHQVRHNNRKTTTCAKDRPQSKTNKSQLKPTAVKTAMATQQSKKREVLKHMFETLREPPPGSEKSRKRFET